MLKTKLLYTILLIICIVFFILYAEPLSLYLLIFIALLPVANAIFILIARKTITAEISPFSDMAVKNENINVSIVIKNRSPISFPGCTVTIEYFNSIMNVKDYMTLNIPVHEFCSEKVSFSLISEYCGILEIKIKSVRILDHIKLFSCRIKPEGSHKITVLPEIYPVDSKADFSMMNTDDSNIFSKYKSGDDPSEIFALKDYAAGDKPNRIHWNLSLKHDELIVRHYSQPVNSSIILILDFCGASGYDARALDTAADVAFSIAFFFAENEIPFKFAYYCKSEDKDRIVNISHEKDISFALNGIFSEGPSEHTDFTCSIKDIAESFSGIFYVTTSPENLSEILKESHSESLRPILIDNGRAMNNTLKNTEITVIPAGKSKQFISEILI